MIFFRHFKNFDYIIDVKADFNINDDFMTFKPAQRENFLTYMFV